MVKQHSHPLQKHLFCWEYIGYCSLMLDLIISLLGQSVKQGRPVHRKLNMYEIFIYEVPGSRIKYCACH